MGVPITFMEHFNPEQFEIYGVSNVNGLLDDVDIIGEKWIADYKANGGTGHITANMHSLVGYNMNGKPVSYYTRIIIRNKHPEPPREDCHTDSAGLTSCPASSSAAPLGDANPCDNIKQGDCVNKI